MGDGVREEVKEKGRGEGKVAEGGMERRRKDSRRWDREKKDRDVMERRRKDSRRWDGEKKER